MGGSSQIQLSREVSASQVLASGLLQRKCACGQHTIAGGECDECGKKPPSLQRATRKSELGTRNSRLETRNSAGVPPIVHEVLRSSGQPLDSATRAFFEPRFGHDFSRVRVHTDSKAAESARAVNALAYTVGQNIVLGDTHDVSSSWESRKLVAHELAHSIQQKSNVEGLTQEMRMTSPNDRSEREAEVAVEAILGRNSPDSSFSLIQSKEVGMTPRLANHLDVTV
jgi:hypothetical protein